MLWIHLFNKSNINNRNGAKDDDIQNHHKKDSDDDDENRNHMDDIHIQSSVIRTD